MLTFFQCHVLAETPNNVQDVLGADGAKVPTVKDLENKQQTSKDSLLIRTNISIVRQVKKCDDKYGIKHPVGSRQLKTLRPYLERLPEVGLPLVVGLGQLLLTRLAESQHKVLERDDTVACQRSAIENGSALFAAIAVSGEIGIAEWCTRRWK